MKKVHGSNLPCFFFEHQNRFLDTLQVPRTWMILSRAVQTSLETIGSSFYWEGAHIARTALSTGTTSGSRGRFDRDKHASYFWNCSFGFGTGFIPCLSGENNESPRGFQKIFSARRIFIMCKFSGMNRRRPH